MNIYIMTDIEGISGVYCTEQAATEGPRSAEGKRLFTRDVNICAEACKKYGVEKVYVRDCHGCSSSLMWENLSPAVDYAVCGMTGIDRFVGIDDCDGVILLGYHAMAGTAHAVLEHTMSGASVQNIYLNGKKTGEIGIDAAICAERGKPVIMVSGDDKACAEAKEFLPWVETAEVKKGVTRYGAVLLPPHTSKQVLEETVKKALENLANGRVALATAEAPVTMRIDKVERAEAPAVELRPYMKVIDNRSYEVVGDNVTEALHRLL